MDKALYCAIADADKLSNLVEQKTGLTLNAAESWRRSSHTNNTMSPILEFESIPTLMHHKHRYYTCHINGIRWSCLAIRLMPWVVAYLISTAFIQICGLLFAPLSPLRRYRRYVTRKSWNALAYSRVLKGSFNLYSTLLCEDWERWVAATAGIESHTRYTMARMLIMLSQKLSEVKLVWHLLNSWGENERYPRTFQ